MRKANTLTTLWGVLGIFWLLPSAGLSQLSGPPDHPGSGQAPLLLAEIAEAASQGDLIRMERLLEARLNESGGEGELRSWLALQVIRHPEMQDQSSPWSLSVLGSMQALFLGKKLVALDAAEAALASHDAAQSPARVSRSLSLWLAHLEMWPPDVVDVNEFIAYRQVGLARLELLRSQHQDDLTVRLLLAHAQLARGNVAKAIELFAEARRDGARLLPAWQNEIDKLAKWRPAWLPDPDLEAVLKSEARPGETLGTIERRAEPDVAQTALDLTQMPELHKLAASDQANLLGDIAPRLGDLNGLAPRGAAQYTPLHLAAELGNTAAIEKLVDAGADLERVAVAVNATRQGPPISGIGIVGSTPLQVAARHGQGDAAEVLFALGAEVDVVDAQSVSPIEAAAAWGMDPLVREMTRRQTESPPTGTPSRPAPLFSDPVANSAIRRASGPGPDDLTTGMGTQPAATQYSPATLISMGMAAPIQSLLTMSAAWVGNDPATPQHIEVLNGASASDVIIFRLAGGAILVVLGFLFRAGPTIIRVILDLVFPMNEKTAQHAGHGAVGRLERYYRGKLHALPLGLIDGGEVEIEHECVTLHGYAPRWPALAGGKALAVAKFLAFLASLLLLILVWSLMLAIAGVAPATTTVIATASVFLLLAPILAFLADRILDVALSEPKAVSIYNDEIVSLRQSSDEKETSVTAKIRKAGMEACELSFVARSAQEARAVMLEFESLSGIKQLV